MKKEFYIKTAILIAVFLCFTKSNAQEYNNWLLSGGAVLNFDTSPATIICNEADNPNEYSSFDNFTVALSDDNGKLILFGCLESGNNNTNRYYVIKNADNNDVIRIEKAEPQNAIACKIPQGGYYIVLVYRTSLTSLRELHIYKFDKNAKLENEYIFNESDYSFFIDFVRLEDCLALIAYRKNQIETYKLTSDGCILWKTSEMILDKFLYRLIPSCDIEQTLDNTTILATTYDIAYVFNFDINSGEVTIAHKFESDKFRTMSFSPTDKYFLIIDDEKLKGFRFDKDFYFVLDNPDIIYDLPNDDNVVCDQCWEMAVGVDGKIYLHNQYYDYILVLDGIESENINESIIQSNCLKRAFFPRIPRISDCKASAHFDNVSVCYGEPLNVMLSGTAPFEVFYTLNGEAKSFKTDNMEYQMPNISGKYVITIVKDNKCESLLDNNNTATIAPNLKTVRIMEKK